jgi:hypothetical protein
MAAQASATGAAGARAHRRSPPEKNAQPFRFYDPFPTVEHLAALFPTLPPGV